MAFGVKTFSSPKMVKTLRFFLLQSFMTKQQDVSQSVLMFDGLVFFFLALRCMASHLKQF